MARLMLTLIACTAVANPSFAEDRELAPRLQQLAEDSAISGCIGVTLRGETLLSSGYGWANREHDVPNSPQTKHRIGSMTKQFTALAILILEDRGKLRVEDTVGKHVSDLPGAWRTLTIHQLLTHTSGLTHSWPIREFAEHCGRPKSLDETLAIFHDAPLLFEPGTKFQYSGVGFFLLAKVIEAMSGETYAEFLRQEIFEPLSMADTGADRADIVLQHRASGYTTDKSGAIVNAPEFPMPMLTGGGNLYSTVEDLARWDRALHDRNHHGSRVCEAVQSGAEQLRLRLERTRRRQAERLTQRRRPGLRRVYSAISQRRTVRSRAVESTAGECVRCGATPCG